MVDSHQNSFHGDMTHCPERLTAFSNKQRSNLKKVEGVTKWTTHSLVDALPSRFPNGARMETYRSPDPSLARKPEGLPCWGWIWRPICFHTGPIGEPGRERIYQGVCCPFCNPFYFFKIGPLLITECNGQWVMSPWNEFWWLSTMMLYHQPNDTGGGSHRSVWDQVGMFARAERSQAIHSCLLCDNCF